LTGEKEPALGGVDEALAVLLVATGLCQLLSASRGTRWM
jgi:hypothetical protein